MNLLASDITEAEVNSAAVEVEPADVPTIETITEPNAENRVGSYNSKTFDEEVLLRPQSLS